ncbi:MAG: beta-1,6-N-acetylglucosaminyltransferase [Burkholderiales bacterium]
MSLATQDIKIVFGILSANNPADIVQQTIDALGNDCMVLVHHDFSQRPDFVLTGENVRILENPVLTEWGNWTLAEATLHLLRHALLYYQFDYFQLLSDSCLPIQPLSEFKRRLLSQRPDAMMDMIDISTDKDLFVSHAYRYMPSKSLVHRMFRRFRIWALGPEPHTLERMAGLGIPIARQTASLVPRIKQITGRTLSLFLHAPNLVMQRKFFVGSLWFCASHQVCSYIVEQASTGNLVKYFSELRGPDEIFFPYVIGNSGFRNIVPANHFTLWKLRGTGPEEIQETDLPDIMSSGKFFARKFSKSSNNPARMAVLSSPFFSNGGI